MSAAPADEAARLRRLLGLAMAPPSPSVWASPTEQLRRVAALTYLLLDHDPPNDAESFLTTGLDDLLRELARSSARRTVVEQSRLRGRVLWSATLAARAERGDGGPIFAYREVRREYDTPENQLLRFVIELLYAGLQSLPAPLRTAECYFPGQGTAEAAPAGPRLARIEAALRRARLSAGLRAAALPERVEARHLLRAETARNEGYAIISRIYRRYAGLASPTGWRAAMGQIGRRVLILPVDGGSDAEPWIELAAIGLRGAPNM